MDTMRDGQESHAEPAGTPASDKTGHLAAAAGLGLTKHTAQTYLPHDQTAEVALCLSGGGFRAALFHLGALRRLRELGVLPRIDTISCVSGGSILAAHLFAALPDWSEQGIAALDWDRQVAGPFKEFTSRNLRSWPLLKYLLPPSNLWRPARIVDTLAARYDMGLGLQGRTLEDLPTRPKFLFCATDMTFGDHWVFEKSGMGDAEAGYVLSGPPRPIAQAAATSSCFPPAFGPVSLQLDPDTVSQGTYDKPDRRTLLRNIHLTDGGVVDNLGVERVWEHAGDLLVSDGGATFQFGWRPDFFWRLLRYTSIADSRGTIVRKRWLIANLTSGLMRGAYWGIASAAADYEPTGAAADPANTYDGRLVQERICSVRTDLDAFTAAEIAVLENHGYIMAEVAANKYATHSMASPRAPFAVPNPAWMDGQKVDRALRDSSKRTLLGHRFPSI